MVAVKRIALFAMLAVLCVIQLRLWFAPGGLAEAHLLQAKLNKAQLENQALAKRNASYMAEINDLKHGHQAIAERARDELGMAKPDETVYRVV